jgi:hypothetical protein
MPKNKVSDPITDQEIAFARLVLSGGMTDRQAAEAAGLNPDSAAYTKSKPRVRAYMLEHRAAVQQQLVQQEVDLSRRAAEGQRRLNVDREQVLDRLWELANLSPELTRGSISGQVKCLAMIAAMQNFIPDRRAVSSEKKFAPAPTPHTAAWLARHQAKPINPQPSPAPPVPPVPASRGACREAQQEDGLARPGVPWGVPEANLAAGSAGDPPPNPSPSQPTFANRSTPSKTPVPYVPLFTSIPDLGVDFPAKRTPLNPFVRPR